MSNFDTVDGLLENAQYEIDQASVAILRSFAPYLVEVYNTIQPPVVVSATPNINVPPPVAPEAPLSFINRKTTLTVPEGSGLAKENSSFWFKSLKSDLDWDKIKDSDITINYDLNNYITPYNPDISGVWRPAILYVDPFSGEKNTNITFADTGLDAGCELGLGLEEFITINNPIFKTWTLQEGLEAKIDWKLPKDPGTCAVLGVLFWYRHYDINRETSAIQTFTITSPSVTHQRDSNTKVNKVKIRIDNKVIELKEQHEHRHYIEGSNTGPVLFGLQGMDEDSYVTVKKNDSSGQLISEDIYQVKEGLWECLGPKRFTPGIDIYMPDSFFSIQYNSYFLVEQLQKRLDEPMIEYYPVTSLKTTDESKYRGCLTSLLNLSNNQTLEKLMISDGLGTTDENIPIHTYMDKEGRNKYIGLKNLARFLSSGPLVDMAAVYAYNKFLSPLDMLPYMRGNWKSLKTKLEDVYGKLEAKTTTPIIEPINNRIYKLPDGFFEDDPTLVIKINDKEIARTSWEKIEDNIIQFNNNVSFLISDNVISVSKTVYITSDAPGILDRPSKGLYNKIEDNNALSFQNTLRLIKTKKDLALALTVFDNVSKNFYLKFPSFQKSKLISKKIIDVPQVYIKMDFEHKRPVGTTATDFWYKQRINVGGTSLYTKLKVPDDTDFEPGEYESLVLAITDKGYTEVDSSRNKIIIYDFLAFDANKSELFNSMLTSMYDNFGVNQEFYKIMDLQKTLASSARDPNQTYNLGLLGGSNNQGQSYRLYKRLNDWTFDFDKALRGKKELIQELKQKNDAFNGSIDLLEDRFLEANASKKSIYPDIKEIYFHRLGGIVINKTLLFTIGKSLYWNYRTGPVPIQNEQYFVKEMPTNITKPDKILVEFESNANLHIRLYDIEVENLRINTYKSAGYRPFPNKIPVRSDDTRVYDQVITNDFNESNFLLSTQYSPPIIAYGGHRKETIEALGVKIPNHPKPIESGVSRTYLVKPENVLPWTAKNSRYITDDLSTRINDWGWSGPRDKSSVKCFLSPQYFYNAISFRKGFFHPNRGWIDYASPLYNSLSLANKTPVIPSGISNCLTYGSHGKTFYPELMTQATADAKLVCEPGFLPKKENILIRDPSLEDVFNADPLLRYNLLPNIVTTNVNDDVNFISFVSAKLSSLNHAFPKDLRMSIFDPRSYRFIAGNIVDQSIARDIFRRSCDGAKPEEIQKLQQLRIKENNSWIGPLSYQPRLAPRFLLFNSTLLNYKKNFNLTFNNYGENLKFASNNDIVLPEDSLDYFIGSSGTIRGFGEFDTDSTKISAESDNTWGLNISDMGGLDSGSVCFQLQVCTGCPVPNYPTLNAGTGVSITPYNLLAYNSANFDSGAFPAGYCFLADFTGKKHLLPPINLEAPYNSQNNEVGNFPCAEQPPPPLPREFVKPIPDPEPVFIPPIHFPLVGLLVHIANMQTMMSLGYDMPYGAFGGVWTPNPFTQNVDLKKKHRSYYQNKGYLQVEGSTASFIRGYGYVKGLSLDYEYGIPNKVELDIQYKNCLWYTIEADIFKYTKECSPILDNTKFKYFVYKKNPTSSPGLPFPYPGFDFSFQPIVQANKQTLVIDGARPFYSFKVGESIKLVYTVKRLVSGVYTEIKLEEDVTISDIKVPKYKNPQYIKSVIDNSMYAENNDLPKDFDPSTTDTQKNDDQFLPGNTTHIYIDNQIPSNDKDEFLYGHIEKNTNNTLMLYKSTLTQKDRLTPFGKWRNVDSMNMGEISPDSVKDQLFSEGGYGWGSNKINPKILSKIKTPDLLGLHNFDYHFGKADYCGRVKIKKLDGSEKTIRIPYNPRLKYSGMPVNPYAQKISNQYIIYTGYPNEIKNISNRIYAHNLLSITSENNQLFDFNLGPSKYEKYYLNKNIAKYYLPYYDLTLDSGLLQGFLDSTDPIQYTVIPNGQELPYPGVVGKYYKYESSDNILMWYPKEKNYVDITKLSIKEKEELSQLLIESTTLSNGTIQFENIFSHVADTEPAQRNGTLLYNDNYYWISIPANASGVLASQSKIPYSIKQECDYLGGNWSSLDCQNVCNTQMVGPLTVDDISKPEFSSSSQNLSMFYLDAASNKCPRVQYELRETTQSFYMGCGETQNDKLVRLDLIFRYHVPQTAHAFISAKELVENSNDIKVRFKYIPRKIQTDFTITLGSNAVNHSQLYFWECHETNKRNVYTEKTRLDITPPFYQVLNEMIFRAWFGERQKISVQDTFGVDTFTTLNHYKWVPYEYDGSGLFNKERETI